MPFGAETRQGVAPETETVRVFCGCRLAAGRRHQEPVLCGGVRFRLWSSTFRNSRLGMKHTIDKNGKF